jgi:hypothetical protein
MREMRWKCAERGCYRKLMPRLGMFDDCFPGRIGMSDVDGIVEIAGRFLLLEWKAEGGRLTTGQRIMFERLTAGNSDPMKFTVIVVSGNPESMDVESLQVFSRGAAGPVEACTMDELKARVGLWSERAQQAKIRPSQRVSA